MLTFIGTARFSWTSAHTSCYATLGGVGGVGGMLTFIGTARFAWTFGHTSYYATLGGWGGGGDVNVHCVC